MDRKSLQQPVTPDPWDGLKRFTPARIALGRSGASLPTTEWLNFKLAHARAQDAVHHPFDTRQMDSELRALGVTTLIVDSNATDRNAFLKKPDSGRRLNDASRKLLTDSQKDFDLAVIVSDGLSAMAAHRQTVPLLAALIPVLQRDKWKLAPIVIARFGRVALEDEIGSLLRAKIALILLGERPGLGSPDSLGAYLVYAPQLSNTDAQRNCVSNIRAQGLSPSAAAETLHYLLLEARKRQLSGIELKDDRTKALCLPE